MLETLARCELINIQVVGLPLQANLMERRYFFITKKGLEFLEAYKKIQELITYLEKETRRQPGGPPMDLVG